VVRYANKGNIMTEQNINFLTTLNIQSISAFNSKLMIQIISGWVLLLFLIYTISLISHVSKQATLDNLTSTQKNLQAQIDKLDKELVSLNSPQSLPLPLINSDSLVGFYRYFKDLARFTPKDIWFNNIVFSQPNNLILLNGSTTSAANIPIFINALKKSKIFNEKKIGTLQIQKIPDTNNVEFTLGTATAIESK
jgi:hypothetical protein